MDVRAETFCRTTLHCSEFTWTSPSAQVHYVNNNDYYNYTDDYKNGNVDGDGYVDNGDNDNYRNNDIIIMIMTDNDNDNNINKNNMNTCLKRITLTVMI